MSAIVDTAALAAALGISARQVRRLTAAGILTTLGRGRLVTRGGHPRWYDLDDATEKYRASARQA